MIAAIILAASQTIAMIVIGRVFQGIAVRHIPHVITLQRHSLASVALLLTGAPEFAWSACADKIVASFATPFFLGSTVHLALLVIYYVSGCTTVACSWFDNVLT